MAVVTGGAAGVGRAVVSALAGRGAVVLVADVDGGRCAATVAEVEAAGGRATPLVVDVCADDAAEAAGRRFPDAAPGEWGRVLELNLGAPMRLTQAALGPLRAAGGGAVVNVASGAGLELSPYGSPEYGAAKAGLIRFTAAVAGLRERFGVRVNCLVPGWIGLPRARRTGRHATGATRPDTTVRAA
ncbi:3-oxoacyl-[acyl-carrier protein] reductase [Jiangella sp. DSM 45060]|nr:3-oxoacyl-[acyl-carrier protein] reductase [Jiangella sp. DSM 45060]